jgi:hypothetical protein
LTGIWTTKIEAPSSIVEDFASISSSLNARPVGIVSLPKERSKDLEDTVRINRSRYYSLPTLILQVTKNGDGYLPGGLMFVRISYKMIVGSNG